MRQPLQIGLFGFGVVGEGIYRVLEQTPSLNANIKKICIKHPEKKRNAPADMFTTDASLLLNDPEINVIVELIDDAADAFRIVTSAMRGGKAVVSANKKMIAEKLPHLLVLQEECKVSFLYEAAVCGSIPIIRNLEEYYDNEMLASVCGIINGSTNFILTKMLREGLSYSTALAEAQGAGFAESDPSLDVSGHDAVNKLCILLLHGHGIIAHPRNIIRKGIESICASDHQYASENGYKIKLIAQATRLGSGDVAAFVTPQFVKEESQLYRTDEEFNGVVLQSAFSDKQFLYGKGAGRFPTAGAVLSDISALRYDYRYAYRKMLTGINRLSEEHYLTVFVSFDDWKQIPTDDFEIISEVKRGEGRQFLKGSIPHSRLASAAWLHHPDVSLILCPNGISDVANPKQLRNLSQPIPLFL